MKKLILISFILLSKGLFASEIFPRSATYRLNEAIEAPAHSNEYDFGNIEIGNSQDLSKVEVNMDNARLNLKGNVSCKFKYRSQGIDRVFYPFTEYLLVDSKIKDHAFIMTLLPMKLAKFTQATNDEMIFDYVHLICLQQRIEVHSSWHKPEATLTNWFPKKQETRSAKYQLSGELSISVLKIIRDQILSFDINPETQNELEALSRKRKLD